MRQISNRYLSEEERIVIADLRRSGLGIREIADKLGRAASTVSRELRRNSRNDGTYRPFEAHRWAVQRRGRRHRRRIDNNPGLGELIAELLAQRWSPQQIARHLRRRFPHDRSMRLCHERIYQATYQPQSRLIRPPKITSAHRGPLRTGRTHRRAHQRPGRRRPRFAQPMLSIHQRPFDPADRSQAGHWEGDLIVGKNQGSAIGTLV
ncbi:IS30 family transposase, partial [Mycobacterium angelicum]